MERRSFELLLAVHRVIISTTGTNDELDDGDDRGSSFGVWVQKEGQVCGSNGHSFT